VKPPEHDHTVWYGEPGFDSLGPRGMLYAHISKGAVRSGMCNPPRNPQVAQALLETLNKWEVRPHPRERKQEEKSKNLRHVISLQPATVGFSAADSTHSLKSAGGMVAGTHGKPFSSSAPTLATGGSASSSRLPSPVPMRGSRVSSAASAFRPSMRGTLAKPRKNSNKAAWEQFELELTQEGKMKKPSLDSAPEGEVKWKCFRLKKNSRDLGYQLDQADAVDLCKLTIYHNGFTRRSTMHGTSSSGFHGSTSTGFPARSSPSTFSTAHQSRQLKDMSVTLTSSSQDVEGISTHTFASELEKDLTKRHPTLQRALPEEAPSSERYLELSNAALKAGPYRLQAMARQANISVLSGMKPPELAELPLAEQNADAYDPLFSSPNTSPRSTHSGKPLPVPYWGRSGSAPMLKICERESSF